MTEFTYKSSKGIEISYLFYKTEKPFVIIFHGWAHSKERWVDFCNKYLNEFSLMIIDLPGFGKSLYNKSVNDLTTYVEPIIELINKKITSISDTIFLGHSLGGCVATAISNYCFPKSMILLDVPLRIIWPGRILNATGRMGHLLVSIGLKSKLLIYFLSRLTVSKFKYIDKLMIKDARQMSSAVAASSLSLLGDKASIPIISNFTIPILFIHGYKDLIVNRNQYKRLGFSDKFEIIFIKDSGHTPFIETEKITSNAIIEFLKKY